VTKTPATAKKSFILYVDLHDVVSEMSEDEAGHLFKAILHYQKFGERPDVPKSVKFTFLHLVSQFKRDNAKWDDIRVKRSDAGKKGAKQKLALAGKRKQKSAKQAVNVSVNVNVSDILNTMGKARRESFQRWMRYKSEKGQTYKPTGFKALVSKWEKVSDERLNAAVTHSSSNNYSGLFEQNTPVPTPNAIETGLTDEDYKL